MAATLLLARKVDLLFDVRVKRFPPDVCPVLVLLVETKSASCDMHAGSHQRCMLICQL